MATPATFERERRALLSRFELHADRKAKPFIALHSGLSHGTGHMRYLLTPDEARELGNALIDMAEFAEVPMFTDALKE